MLPKVQYKVSAFNSHLSEEPTTEMISFMIATGTISHACIEFDCRD